MNVLENITFRRNRTKSETTTNDTDPDILLANSPIDGTTTSLPDISDDEDDQSTKLKRQLEQLTLELNSAHNEIESLTLENTKLKHHNQELQKQNALYKKVACSPAKLKSQTPKNKKTSAKINLSVRKNTEKSSECTEFTTTSKSTSPNGVQNQYNQQLNKSITDGVINSTGINRKRKTEVQITKLNNDSKPNKSLMKKICILSSNKNNKILEIAEDVFPNYRICHYLTPNCGVKYLISDLDLKLKDYNMNDYCLIFVGEEDFRRTKNYVELTIYIRETLSKVQHTNIILCAPTFKLNGYSTMFNARIETFNSLIYLDAYSYNYAYLFDSNYYIDYDFNMFTKSSTSVNNRGMANIFHNIGLMINEFTMHSDLNSCNSSDKVTDFSYSVQSSVTDENELFFL